MNFKALSSRIRVGVYKNLSPSPFLSIEKPKQSLSIPNILARANVLASART